MFEAEVKEHILMNLMTATTLTDAFFGNSVVATLKQS